MELEYQFEHHYKQENFIKRAFEISGKDAFTHSLAKTKTPSVHKQSPPTAKQVHAVLESYESGEHNLSFQDLICLLSPAADAYLERIVEYARLATRQRFGKVIQLYAPLYLSNHCQSTCTYCGFSRTNAIQRLTLNPQEVYLEAGLLHKQGIRHILLLTGESYKETPLSYLETVIQKLVPDFASVAIEVYPMDIKDYQVLRQAGVDSVAIYQETYDPKYYQEVHLGGMKKRLFHRLNAPDRIASAGIRRISIGALLGLSDPAAEVFFTAQHAHYLIHRYWQTEISISLPRLRPAVGLDFIPSIPDEIYLRFLCALRLFLPETSFNLSTREPIHIRELLADICVTHMSAGSKTEPGGYSGKKSTEQFQINDDRPIDEISQALRTQNLEPVLVDWNPLLK